MDKSFNEKWAAMVERLNKPTPPERDTRPPGAYWPAHNSQDLPDTNWYVKDPE
jgi:hypothetical protein